MQSNSIYDREEANNEIGQALHDAKRRMLDAHKKGVPLADASETFFAECKNVIDRASIRLEGPEHPQPSREGKLDETDTQPRKAAGYSLLDKDEINYICDSLASEASELQIGQIVLLLEHLVACDFTKSPDLNPESQAIAIAEKLVGRNNETLGTTIRNLRSETLESVMRNMDRIKSWNAEKASAKELSGSGAESEAQ